MTAMGHRRGFLRSESALTESDVSIDARIDYLSGGAKIARMAEMNVQIARRGYEAALTGDLDGVRDFLDPDVKWHSGDPNAEGACQNRQQALRVIQQASSQGSIGELVDVVGAGDRVVVTLRPAGGRGTVANLTTFRDGKAIEMVHYPNPSDALKAARL